MMRPPTRRGIFTLAVLAVLSWLVAREPREAAVDPIGRPDVRLNYALYDFRGRLLDETGAVNFRIEAPELRNDAETGIGTVESPRIRIHENDDRWYIQAESAIISPDREQVIRGLPVARGRRHRSIAGDLIVGHRAGSHAAHRAHRSAGPHAPAGRPCRRGRHEAGHDQRDLSTAERCQGAL
jgi:hypothetical protein